MKGFLTVLFIGALAQAGKGQFVYFNQVTGQQGDMNAEGASNVEVVQDGYVTWGGGIDEVGLNTFLRKYNFDGSVTNENILYDVDEYFYAGITNSMQWNPYSQQFVVLQGAATTEDVKGRLLIFNQNLELLGNQSYNNYSPYTYFFGFHIEPDGYIIFGEQGGQLNSCGTFIMKLDFDGNVIWSEIMQPEVYQHIYRNNSIIELEDGYLIAGGSRYNGTSSGLLTIVNDMGETISEVVIEDDNELESPHASAVKLNNGEILINQSIPYAHVDEFLNPHVFWCKIRLSKFNPETEELYWQQDYHDNYEFILGGAIDMEATLDGGAILVGGRLGWIFDSYAFMMKIDSAGNEEWFREYTYESCDNCNNTLYDVELAPDGGYIAAGSFTNWSVDPRNMSWLLKIDACGDVEWQDCQLTTVSAAKPENRIRLFPNPTEDEVFLESNLPVMSWQLFDLSGRQIERGSISANTHPSIKFTTDATGTYLLKLVMEDGSEEAYKLNIVK